MAPTVCVLASDSLESRAMAAAIAEDFDVCAVIFEHRPRSSAWRTLRFRTKRLGLRRVLGQLAMVGYDRLWVRRKSAGGVRDQLEPFPQLPASVPVHSVPSVNSEGVSRLLRQYEPAVCVVTGTSIIRDRILQLVPEFLNIHCGITPGYRGVHGGFWAIVERDFDNIGVTIHKVDPGVDTGGIVYQGSVDVDSRAETYRTLAAKQYAAGIPLMKKAVGDALAGTLQTIERTDLTSKQWYAPTLLDYLRFKRVLRSRT